MSFVTRFAPSPTGYLHRGHALSALTAFNAARLAAGRFLLRIEDIDTTRCRPAFTEAIFDDLAWLGLSWEKPVRLQSDHLPDYRAALERLLSDGLLYRCFRTRREVLDGIAAAPHGPPRDHRLTEPRTGDFAWRLDGAAALAKVTHADLTIAEFGQPARPLRTEAISDVVLARKDVGVSYHLAVVVDDAIQGVTEVIRGEDLAALVDIQRLLQALLDLPPVRYRHHRLLLRPDGMRYAKRDSADTLRDLRRHGLTAAALHGQLGFADAPIRS